MLKPIGSSGADPSSFAASTLLLNPEVVRMACPSAAEPPRTATVAMITNDERFIGQLLERLIKRLIEHLPDLYPAVTRFAVSPSRHPAAVRSRFVRRLSGPPSSLPAGQSAPPDNRKQSNWPRRWPDLRSSRCQPVLVRLTIH